MYKKKGPGVIDVMYNIYTSVYTGVFGVVAAGPGLRLGCIVGLKSRPTSYPAVHTISVNALASVPAQLTACIYPVSLLLLLPLCIVCFMPIEFLRTLAASVRHNSPVSRSASNASSGLTNQSHLIVRPISSSQRKSF
jgi:hypothetical protein